MICKESFLITTNRQESVTGSVITNLQTYSSSTVDHLELFRLLSRKYNTIDSTILIEVFEKENDDYELSRNIVNCFNPYNTNINCYKLSTFPFNFEELSKQNERKITFNEYFDNFIKRIKILERQNIDLAVDFIFEELNSKLKQGMFELCKKILLRINLKELSEDSLLSFLTITFSASPILKDSRKSYFYKVKEEFKQRKIKNHEKILYGLQYDNF